jgi:hypothetical protein
MVLPQGGGVLQFVLDLGNSFMGTGTETMTSDCSPVDNPVSPVMPALSPEYFTTMGSPSGSTFRASDPDAAPMFWWLSDAVHVQYQVTWDLKLVHP